MEIPGGVSAVSAFRHLFDTIKVHGPDSFIQGLRQFSVEWGWEAALALGQPEHFRRRALWLFLGQAAISYREFRSKKLNEENHHFRVYRCYSTQPKVGCHHVHGELDGIVLPASHPFFTRYMPPTLLACRCAVFGAESIDRAIAWGGDPSKPLPAWALEEDPCTGHPKNVDALFSPLTNTSTLDLLCFILNGQVDHLNPDDCTDVSLPFGPELL